MAASTRLKLEDFSLIADTLARKRGPQGGFTLLEIIVVVAILGILASILWPNVVGLLDRADEASVDSDTAAVTRATSRFKIDRHKGPDGTNKWGQAAARRLYPTEDGKVGDIELNVSVEDPDAPLNFRIDQHVAGPGTGTVATDTDIANSLAWLGLLVNEPFNDSSAKQQARGEASPQDLERGEYLPAFPASAHSANTEQDGGGSFTAGDFRYVVLHNGKVAAAYKSGATWYARSQGAVAAGGGGLTRVTNGIVVLYEFDDGSGSTVADTSGNGTPLNLTIETLGSVTWQSGALRIDVETIVESSVTPNKVYTDVIGGSPNGITIEAWIKPANATQGGPSRIVTHSLSTSNRNFTLAQAATEYDTRLRTSDVLTSSNGIPSQATSGSAVATSTQHVVYTYNSTTGARKTCVDGVVNASDTAIGTGDFSNWNSAYKFALANEILKPGVREWLGTYYLVAVYDRALSGTEVTQNFNIGP